MLIQYCPLEAFILISRQSHTTEKKKTKFRLVMETANKASLVVSTHGLTPLTIGQAFLRGSNLAKRQKICSVYS
jgi:hypothetical protein